MFTSLKSTLPHSLLPSTTAWNVQFYITRADLNVIHPLQCYERLGVEGMYLLLCYSMMKVLLLYQQCDWSLSHWRKPERSILIENSDVMDREGTSQAPSLRSLLLAVSLFHPPFLSLFPCFFFLTFFFVLAGYSFCSSGITELKPNSSLAGSQKETASGDVGCRLCTLSSISHLHP